jgi:hypothetical protein
MKTPLITFVLISLFFGSFGCEYGSTIWSSSLGGEAHHILRTDNGLLFVSDGFRGVHAIAFDSTTASIVSRIDTDGEAFSSVLDPSSSHLLVADGNNGLVVLDVTNPASMSILSKISTGGFARKVIINNAADVAFVASEKSLVIVNISSLASPLIVANHSVGDNANDVYLSQDQSKIFMAIDNTGVIILDVTNLQQPNVVSSFNTPGYSKAILVSESDGLIYVSDSFTGIRVFQNDGTARGYYSTNNISVNMIARDRSIFYAADRFAGLMIFNASNVDSLVLKDSFPLTTQGDRGESLSVLSNTVVALGIRGAQFGQSKIQLICVDPESAPTAPNSALTSQSQSLAASTTSQRSIQSTSRTGSIFVSTKNSLTSPVEEIPQKKKKDYVSTAIIVSLVGIIVIFFVTIMALGIYRKRKGKPLPNIALRRTISKRWSERQLPTATPAAAMPEDHPKPVCPNCHKYWNHTDKCCGDCGSKLLVFPTSSN